VPLVVKKTSFPLRFSIIFIDFGSLVLFIFLLIVSLDFDLNIRFPFVWSSNIIEKGINFLNEIEIKFFIFI